MRALHNDVGRLVRLRPAIFERLTSAARRRGAVVENGFIVTSARADCIKLVCCGADRCLLVRGPRCGGEMRIIAFITEGAAIREILGHMGESTSPPHLLPARGPPLWAMPGVKTGGFDPQFQPAPDYEFDQRIAC